MVVTDRLAWLVPPVCEVRLLLKPLDVRVSFKRITVTMGAMASQITSLTIRLLSRLFRRRSKKTSKLCVTGLCAGNSPVTGEFPAQRASNAEMFPFDDVNMWTPGQFLNAPLVSNFIRCKRNMLEWNWFNTAVSKLGGGGGGGGGWSTRSSLGGGGGGGGGILVATVVIRNY